MPLGVLLALMPVYNVRTSSLWKSEEGAESPGTAVRDDCGLSCGSELSGRGRSQRVWFSAPKNKIKKEIQKC